MPFGESKGPPFWLKFEDFAFVFGEKRVLENSQRMVQIIENTNTVVGQINKCHIEMTVGENCKKVLRFPHRMFPTSNVIDGDAKRSSG